MRNSAEDDGYAVDLVKNICRIAEPVSYMSDARRNLRSHGVLAAVEKHDTAVLFDWLMNAFSFQGISDNVAHRYIAEHGQAEFRDILKKLDDNPACPKLKSYWHFVDCKFQKSNRSCSNHNLLKGCPLPSHDLRNGRLNQTAYSLFLFIRDVAGGDLVRWIDRQILQTAPGKTQVAVLRENLIGPMRCIYGISDKVLTMTLATLLIAGSQRKSQWLEIGCSMIAIDTLVHNFLHRTGILRRFKAEHRYGARCYEVGFCAHIIDRISRQIDARQFNERYPTYFPRFVQNSIWRFCGQSEFNICNGIQINDRRRCDNKSCRFFLTCDRVRLRNQNNRSTP